MPLLTKRTPGVAGVVGSGAKQQPRPNVSGQAHEFSFWSSSPMSKMASSAKKTAGEYYPQVWPKPIRRERWRVRLGLLGNDRF